MSKAADLHKSRVAALGCIIKDCGKPAALHHPRFAVGMSQRASDFLVIPLCPDHHQNGGHGVAIHAGQATFEQNFGSEPELLAQTIERLQEEQQCH
ncbi:MAG: DUF968 domain-containing protein [Anderseniella sp.]|nr:DUF968 domain-containing protein [Anderseniella sp.]